MLTLSRLLLLVALVASPVFAQTRKIGEVRVDVDANTIPVRVSSTSPELQQWAQAAFSTHGRYKLVASGQAYDIRFASGGPTQVRVDITKGSAATPVGSTVATGTSARNALFRAADFAVEKTNGLGLRGYFTARLAFIAQAGGPGKGDIFMSDLFFGESKQLTHDRALVMSPRWAPDASRVIYTGYFKSGAPDLYTVTPSGSREIFASFRGTNTGASFSPNGQQVAMVLSGTGNTEIWVGPSRVGAGKPTQLTRSEAVKSSPAWSPDGRQLVFEMEPGPQLYVMPATGGPARKLSNLGATYAAEPDWSRANPNKIAYAVRVNGRFQIAVYDLAKGSGQVVSKADFDGVEPSWLGDGRHLVYTARDRSTSVLCILDTETGKSTRISPAANSVLQASVWTQ